MKNDNDNSEFTTMALIVVGCIIGAALVLITKAAARVFA